MPLVGGGGAGNIAGGTNPAGTGTGLNHIGDHVYANSGQLDDVNTYATGLLFNVGSEYIVGEFQFDAMVQTSSPAAGDITLFKILLNGEAVSITKLDGAQEDMPPSANVPLILAPYTRVEVQYVGSTNSADYPTFLRFTGRVYA
jgi:hypothetical protein